MNVHAMLSEQPSQGSSMLRYIFILFCFALHLGACNATDTEMSNPQPQIEPSDVGVASPDSAVPLPGNTSDSAVTVADVGVSTPPQDMHLIVPDMMVTPTCENACVDASITWGRIGGRTAYDINYSIEACRTQSVWIDTPFANDPNAHRCERTIPDCEEVTGIEFERIRQALAQVTAQGLCNTVIIYGIDSRPWDGQVFSIRYADKECLLGDPCDGSQPECIDPPELLLETADLLWSFGRDMEQNDPSCANLTNGL